MRKHRELRQGVWYEIRTRVNNHEPLFRRWKALAVFDWVFRETQKKYVFEVQAMRLAGDLLSFYIKPADGFQLPTIMKWMKQVFAVQFNQADGRSGHIWGDRYWSRILPGEPPEESAEGDAKEMAGAGARPCPGETADSFRFSPLIPLSAPHPPG
jgi:REP element-mobilizing transposase RayT